MEFTDCRTPTTTLSRAAVLPNLAICCRSNPAVTPLLEKCQSGLVAHPSVVGHCSCHDQIATRTCRGDLSEDRATAFEERQAEVEALQRAVESLGEALGQAPPALAPITTARERGEGAISLIVARVSGHSLWCCTCI